MTALDTPCIGFEGVWKKFRRGEVHDSLRDLIPSIAHRLVEHREDKTGLERREFWALQDVSFRVDPGCALGIIGANGAGKSTVLKTLTRILRPTRGSCFTVGRVGSLIEIAAGFHQDLTGRENIFLQGAIMGMPTEVIKRRFDEIVEFSGIGEFLDTPVKRYSSGMNARLGFAIAAHLDPDVLIVDEVLAVGDVAFQQKAFGRLRSLVESGMPVIVVSHQLERIAELCTRCIQLEHGRVVFDGDAPSCISAYTSGASAATGTGVDGSPIVVSAIRLVSERNVVSGATIELSILGAVLSDERAELGVRVRSAQTGSQVFATNNGMCDVSLPFGPFTMSLSLQMNVAPGIYSLEPYLVLWKEGREEFHAAGPVTHVQVMPDKKAFGVSQLNPRMSVSAGQASVATKE